MELYERTGRRLLVYLARRLHHVDAAAELWSECWAVAFENWTRCKAESPGEAEAWVFGIAGNQLSAYYRSGAIERRALERLQWTVPAFEGELDENLARVAELDGLRGMLADALGQLPAKRRRAVRLRIVDGLAYPEVAPRWAAQSKLPRPMCLVVCVAWPRPWISTSSRSSRGHCDEWPSPGPTRGFVL